MSSFQDRDRRNVLIDYEDTASCQQYTRPQQENSTLTTKVGLAFSLHIVPYEGLALKGDIGIYKFGTEIPRRASRTVYQQTTDVEQEYDDDVGTTPRSALRYRSVDQHPQEQPTHTTDELDAPVSHRISGSSRLALYVLLLLCIAFFVSGIQTPMLAGNVITVHIPLVWLVSSIAIFIVMVTLLRTKR